MYQLIGNKNNISEYLIIDNKLVISNGSDLLLENEIIFLANETYISNIKKYNQTVYVFEYKVGLNYFNIGSPNAIVVKDFIKDIGVFLSENDVVYSYYSDDYLTSYRCRINLLTEQKKWTIESYFGNGEVIDNYLYTTCANNRICKINLDNPEQPLWQFDLTQLGAFKDPQGQLLYNVVQFIGVWQDLLLIQLKNARLIALNINSGELTHDIALNKTNPPSPSMFYDPFIKMHLDDDKILWLTNQILLHIDLNTFNVKIVKEYHTVPKENQWRFMQSTYHKDKLYFTADYAWQYVTPSHVGVMDANNGEILWSQQLEKTGGLPEPPKVTDDKLYIRTNNGVLHIFEKTQNETS